MMRDAEQPTAAAGADAPRALPAVAAVPLWALGVITWINSLGSGLLWSGIPFVVEEQYGFSQVQSLTLALVESVIYVAVALASGPLLRAFQRRGGTARRWLAFILIGQACGSMLALAGQWGVVAAACLLSAVGAAIWPVMESYLSSGRHGHDMRRAIGKFNVIWMSATGASLLLMAPILAAGYGQYTLLVLVPVSLVSLVILRWFPQNPATHDAAQHHAHVPGSYRALLHAMRFTLPVSYVFIAIIGPILPFRLTELNLDAAIKTPMASIWMFARMATVVLLAYLPFWHGRWGAIALGAAMLAGGFAAMLLATSPWVMAAGLACFGAGHGVLYYAALYYAMAVGSAEVDAGGIFEALIGVGYVVGPAAALLSGSNPGTLISAVWAIAAVGMVPAAWAWFRSRPARAPRGRHAAPL